jgi:hypothetical protein
MAVASLHSVAGLVPAYIPCTWDIILTNSTGAGCLAPSLVYLLFFSPLPGDVVAGRYHHSCGGAWADMTLALFADVCSAARLWP